MMPKMPFLAQVGAQISPLMDVAASRRQPGVRIRETAPPMPPAILFIPIPALAKDDWRALMPELKRHLPQYQFLSELSLIGFDRFMGRRSSAGTSTCRV